MLLCQSIGKCRFCCSTKKRFSFMFLFFVYLFPFGSYFVFRFCKSFRFFSRRILLFFSVESSQTKYTHIFFFSFAFGFVHFRGFLVFSRLILLFHEYIEDHKSKMCLCAPYLKNYVFCTLSQL